MHLNNTSIIASSTVDEGYSAWFIAFLWILTLLFSVETLLGNLMVLLAYRLDRHIQRQMSNQFIVSLAISDMVIGLEGFPLLTVYVTYGQKWPLGVISCQVWLTLDYTLCLVSILTVLLITVDRYGSVVYPAKYLQWQSERKIQHMIACSWIVPALFFGVLIFGWTAFTGQSPSNPSDCYAPFLNDPYLNMTMYIVYYWTTLVAMLILYRGIHQTAKTLEEKGVARERRNMAILMGQRCMTQVSVGLLLQSTLGLARSQTQATEVREELKPPPTIADSGYVTTTVVHTGNSAEVANNEDEKQSPPRLTENRKVLTRQASSIDYFENISLISSFNDISLSSLLTLRSSSICNGEKFCKNRLGTGLGENGNQQGLEECTSWQHRHESEIAKILNKTDLTKTMSAIPTQRPKPPPIVHQKSFDVADLAQKNIGEIQLRDMLNAKTEYEALKSPSHSSSSSNSSPATSKQKPLSPIPDIKLLKPSSCRRKVSLAEIEEMENEPDVVPDPQTSVKPDRESSKVPTSSGASSNQHSPAKKPKRKLAIPQILNAAQFMHRRRKRTRAERRAKKAFRTITFIVGFFALFWSPYFVVATIYGFCPECVPSVIFLLSYYLCYLNSSGNPFAYALANRQFRTAFWRMMRGDFRRFS